MGELNDICRSAVAGVWRMRLLLVVYTAIFALSMQPVLACRSIRHAAAKEVADIIFVGIPAKVSLPLSNSVVAKNQRQKIYEFSFNITQMLKGPSLATVVLRSTDEDCSGFAYTKKLNPSLDGHYLIYANVNEINGIYETDTYFPNGKIPKRIDPRFPSVIWALASGRLTLTVNGLAMRDRRFEPGLESGITQPVGMILPHRDGVLDPGSEYAARHR